MIFFAFLPRGVLLLIDSLSISPVEMWGIFNLFAITSACVPFPAPGGPSNIIFIYQKFQWQLPQHYDVYQSNLDLYASG